MFPVRAVAATTGKAVAAPAGAPLDLLPAIVVGHKKYAHRPSRTGAHSHSQRLRRGSGLTGRDLCAQLLTVIDFLLNAANEAIRDRRLVAASTKRVASTLKPWVAVLPIWVLTLRLVTFRPLMVLLSSDSMKRTLALR